MKNPNAIAKRAPKGSALVKAQNLGTLLSIAGEVAGGMIRIAELREKGHVYVQFRAARREDAEVLRRVLADERHVLDPADRSALVRAVIDVIVPSTLP